MNGPARTTAPSMWTRVSGRMLGAGCGVVPNAISIAACAMSRTPRRGDQLGERGGVAQRPEHGELDQRADGQDEQQGERHRGPWAGVASLPVVSAQKAYPPSIAMAPVERLMTPDPR